MTFRSFRVVSKTKIDRHKRIFYFDQEPQIEGSARDAEGMIRDGMRTRWGRYGDGMEMEIYEIIVINIPNILFNWQINLKLYLWQYFINLSSKIKVTFSQPFNLMCPNFYITFTPRNM